MWMEIYEVNHLSAVNPLITKVPHPLGSLPQQFSYFRLDTQICFLSRLDMDILYVRREKDCSWNQPIPPGRPEVENSVIGL